MREEPKTIRCPYCGAPYRETIPYGTVQLRCGYCGAVYVPNALNAEIYRCANHPQTIAVGKCNDCGENFCEKCLRVYDLFDTSFRSELAKLYLCPDCLKRRYAERARSAIFGGALLLIVGMLAVAVFAPVAPFGAVLWIGFPSFLGGAILLYGWWQKTHVPEDSTLEKLRIQDQRKREAMFSPSSDMDADEAYDKLVGYYANHWGATEGLSLLDMEIAAHVRAGDSYPEAVMKVYKRQKEKIEHRKR